MIEDLTLKEKVILLKASLAEIKLILQEDISLDEKAADILAIIDDDLNHPTQKDLDVLLRLQHKVLENK